MITGLRTSTMQALSARREILGPAALAVVGLVAAALLGRLATASGSSSLLIGLMICALPALPILFARPDICAVLAVAVTPFGTSVAPGSLGVEIGVPDLLLALTFLGVLYRLGFDAQLRSRLAALRPLLIPVVVYVAVAVVTSAPHATRATVIALLQQVEVVGIPLIVGVALLTARASRVALTLFLVAALVVATAALAEHSVQSTFLGIQKNPAGQFIADALFVSMIVVRRMPIRIVVIAYLIVGMYFTYSRGAVLGVLVGVAAFLLLGASTATKLAARLVAVAVAILALFVLLPHKAQERLQGNVTTTEFNDHIRRAYIDDAEAVIRAHPIVGVGIGNYLAGSPTDLTQTDDPHNVVLLEAAEGGYPLLLAFAVLQLGTVVVVFRRRQTNPWAPVAVAVQSAIITHSFVDVYWVRGTPVLGWVLVGLALSVAPSSSTPRRRSDPVSPSDTQPLTTLATAG